MTLEGGGGVVFKRAFYRGRGSYLDVLTYVTSECTSSQILNRFRSTRHENLILNTRISNRVNYKIRQCQKRCQVRIA